MAGDEPVVLIGSGPDVKFRTTDLQPPSNLYVSREDHIFVNSFGGAAGLVVGINGRVMLPTGRVVEFNEVHAPNSDRTIHTTVIPIPEGFLLNVFVFLNSGTAKRGQCYIVLGLGRGDGPTPTNHQVFIQGYVGNNVNLAFPGDRLQQPTEGPGFCYTTNPAPPAAGAEFSITVPAGARWLVNCLACKLTTSAVVNSRFVVLQGVNAGLTYRSAMSPALQAASLAFAYRFGVGLQSVAGANGTTMTAPLLSRLTLGAADTIASSTSNLDVGDQWAQINVSVEEWLEP